MDSDKSLERYAAKLEVENAQLRRINTGLAQTVPETEVELAKDIYVSKLFAGKYSPYSNDNLALGNYNEDDARIILCYQSLVDFAVENHLDHGDVDLAGFLEVKKMTFARVATATGHEKGGFLLKNIRTQRNLSESEFRESSTRQAKDGIIKKMRPAPPTGDY